MRALTAAAVLFATLHAQVGRADTLNTNLDTGLDGVVNVYYSGWGTSLSVYAGPFEASLNGGPSFDAYCVDLDHWDNMPAHYPVTLLSTDLLTTGNGSPANGPGIAWLYNTYQGTISDSTHGAALQLAIWEMLTDGDSSGVASAFATGNFKYVPANATNPVLLDAQGYLNAWYNNGHPHTSTATWLKANHDPDNDMDDDGVDQSLVGPPPVPEPGSFALLAIGGLPLLVWRRRRLA